MTTDRPTHKTATASASRRVKIATNTLAFYARAAYVTPKVALDKRTASALRRFMRREGLGVSDAIRAAILCADANKTKTPGTR